MNYDAIIIGAGMSGLAAGIRLQMFDRKVLILESHFAPGGLNSYYTRGNQTLDVGLHAMTNYIKKGEKGRPLNKLLKQLRIPYDSLELSPQNRSRIHFPHHCLEFTNEIEFLINEIEVKFPTQVDGFNNLIQFIKNFDETNLANKFTPTRPAIAEYITEPYLIEMILSPLLIYGSALPNDMDLSQFVIMFKSIYLEGFARPKGGVRKIIDILLARFAKLGGTLKYSSKVATILTKDGCAYGVKTEVGEEYIAPLIFSSAGLPETLGMVDGPQARAHEVGEMSFSESILCFKDRPKDFGIDDTIIFYNNGPKYKYQKPIDFFDPNSAVICMPNNYGNDDYLEGMLRFTFISNFERWNDLRNIDKAKYKEKKAEVLECGQRIFKNIFPHFESELVFQDVFTPATIKRYTGHLSGTVYGSPVKARDGQSGIKGLQIIGTDQGFLGIVGAMLSGISIANLYGLKG
ncbi:MAG: NAD(P)/FAD-dependent oxidoreductase [Bacteriovoracaceae bacterium]|nr:NAD(P)/FAD-dependent oxidoreductase [Bacteriovoracaceae bacterium]